MNGSDSCRDHNDIYAQYSKPIQNIHRSTAMTTRHRIPKNLPFFIRVLEFTSCDKDICMHPPTYLYLYADATGKILVWLLKI